MSAIGIPCGHKGPLAVNPRHGQEWQPFDRQCQANMACRNVLVVEPARSPASLRSKPDKSVVCAPISRRERRKTDNGTIIRQHLRRSLTAPPINGAAQNAMTHRIILGGHSVTCMWMSATVLCVADLLSFETAPERQRGRDLGRCHRQGAAASWRSDGSGRLVRPGGLPRRRTPTEASTLIHIIVLARRRRLVIGISEAD
jgi:hypothetical protein